MVKAKKLPSGRWRARVQIESGRGSQKYETFIADTEDEANFMALEYELKNQHKTKVDMTFAEAIDKYIESKTPLLSPSTIDTYKKLKRNYFIDIQNKRIRDITQEDIQKEINKQAKTLSPKSIKCNHGFLYAVFKEFNPTFHINTTLPKNKKYIPNIPDSDDIKIILEAVRGTNIEVPVLLALWLGLRMSEIRGLKWKNVQGDKIYIKEAVVDAENKAVTKGTKSEAGTRTLYMPTYLKDILDKLPKSSEYVVTMKRPTIYDNYIRMLSNAGLPHSRFHDLRHANASIMLALNVPDKYAMERLGHATNGTLKNIYQHTMNSEKADINNRVNTYFETLVCHNVCHEK